MSTETTDLEKKNLEAHVDLCAERYKNLENRFQQLQDKVNELDEVMHDIRDMMVAVHDKQNDRMIGYMAMSIGTLLAVIGYLVVEYII